MISFTNSEWIQWMLEYLNKKSEVCKVQWFESTLTDIDIVWIILCFNEWTGGCFTGPNPSSFMFNVTNVNRQSFLVNSTPTGSPVNHTRNLITPETIGIVPFPIGSMYAIYGNIYHQYTPNVGIYTIHGSYGFSDHGIISCVRCVIFLFRQSNDIIKSWRFPARHGATPSHHPFICRWDVQWKKAIHFWGYPHVWNPPWMTRISAYHPYHPPFFAVEKPGELAIFA